MWRNLGYIYLIAESLSKKNLITVKNLSNFTGLPTVVLITCSDTLVDENPCNDLFASVRKFEERGDRVMNAVLEVKKYWIVLRWISIRIQRKMSRDRLFTLAFFWNVFTDLNLITAYQKKVRREVDRVIISAGWKSVFNAICQNLRILLDITKCWTGDFQCKCQTFLDLTRTSCD